MSCTFCIDFVFREGTLTALRSLGLEKYVDLVVCGDDSGSRPKPNPHNALAICRALGVDPQVRTKSLIPLSA